MVKMGTVWDRTAEFISDNLGAVLPIALVAFFVPASIGGNFQAVMPGAGPSLALVLRLVQLLFAVLSLWGSLAIVAMALDLATEHGSGRIALRRLPAALLVWVVVLVAALALALPIPFILAGSGVDMVALANGEMPAISGPVASTIALYGLALFGVLLWLAARLAVVNPVIVREKGLLSAFGQSWALTRGATWRILGVILLYAIVSWVAQLAAKTVFGSIFALVAGGTVDGLSLGGVLTSIVAAAVQAGFMVVGAAFTAKLYLALARQASLRNAATPA
ncbi:hypothetical protein AB2M62_13030 [Sphingomonas sp. MMS12-HWE2-04]|uniref:hypothetical protein n=1 Tax=Sphingomonas sp. MMS12-HWE2-04 TaxID=3234199 RepID=UPI00384EDF93